MYITKRLKLIPIDESCLDLTREWANDYRLNRLILRSGHVSSDDQIKWYDRLRADDTRIAWAIRTADSNIHIGNCGFYHIDTVNKRSELWILIGDENYTGQKLGSEVIERMLAHGFEKMNMHKIYLHVGLENHRAIALYKNFSFRQDGILRDHYLIQGLYVDVLCMSLLRSEYGSQK